MCIVCEAMRKARGNRVPGSILNWKNYVDYARQAPI